MKVFFGKVFPSSKTGRLPSKVGEFAAFGRLIGADDGRSDRYCCNFEFIQVAMYCRIGILTGVKRIKWTGKFHDVLTRNSTIQSLQTRLFRDVDATFRNITVSPYVALV